MALSYPALSRLAHTSVGAYVIAIIMALATLFCADKTAERVTGCSVADEIVKPIIAQVFPSPILGIENNEARYVLNEYNAYVAEAHAARWANQCLSHKREFEMAAHETDYPVYLLMGVAFLEGRGCRFLNSEDGGSGPMQVTTPDQRHLERAAKILGIPASHNTWRTNYLHNVVMGAVMLSDYEERLGSRGPGLLAYNAGPTAVRDYMDRAGRRPGERMTLSQFRGTIPAAYSDGSRPRRYVDRTLAAAFIVSLADKGLPLTKRDKIELTDIPGAVP